MSSNTNAPPPHARPRISLTKQSNSVTPGQAPIPYPSPSLTSRSLPRTDLESSRSSIISQASTYLSHRSSYLSYASKQSPAGYSPSMSSGRNDDASSQRSLSPSEPPYRTPIRRLPTPPSPQPRAPQATRIVHGVETGSIASVAGAGYQTSIPGQHLNLETTSTHRGFALPAVKEQGVSFDKKSEKKSDPAFSAHSMYDYHSRPVYMQTAHPGSVYGSYADHMYHPHIVSGSESVLFQDGRAQSPAPAYVASPSPPPPNMPYTHSSNSSYPSSSYSNISPQSAYPSPPQSDPRLIPTPDNLASTSYFPRGPPQNNQPEASTSAQPGFSPPQEHSTPRPTPSLALSTISSGSDDSRNPPAPKAFVYPGGRSVAKPKVRTPSSSSSRSLFAFRSRKKKAETPVTSPSSAPPPELSHPEDFVHIDRTTPSNVTSPKSFVTSLAPSETHHHRPNILGSESSASSHGLKKTSSPFVYPSSRSTARPKPKPKTPISEVNPNMSSDTESTPVPAKSHLRKISDPSGVNFVEYEEKSKIMGITVKKKKRLLPVPPSPDTVPRPFIVPPIEVTSFQTDSPVPDERQDVSPLSPLSERDVGDTSMQAIMEEVVYVPKYLNVYPLSSYDVTLLKQDKLTSILLRQLNANGSPSFHDYGNDPPADVLDLGCGQGHWVFHAARTWKGYDTRVVGYDIVDVMKNLLPEEHRYGIPENVSFRKGNFLKDQLPFEDESFDLVRVANLSLCIPAEKWEFVLDEVHRVLRVAGRLELIDDHVFFPLAKAMSPDEMVDPRLSYPQLDVDIPSSPPFSSAFCRESNVSVVDLYGGQRDEGDGGDGASIQRARHISMLSGLSSLRLEPPSSTPPPIRGDLNHPWIQQASACQGLETAFEDMLGLRYGINTHPSTFLLEMMRNIFNHSRKVTTLHLTLAPSESSRSGTPSPAEGAEGGDGTNNGDGSESNTRGQPSRPPLKTSMVSSIQAPGLMLWPSTFIPMAAPEIEEHALHNPRVLLSCREKLIEFLREESGGELEAIQEALWEYERFLPTRLSLPANIGSMTPIPSILPHGPSEENLRSQSSTPSTVSSSTWSAVQQYQTDIREHLGWTNSPEPEEASTAPSTPRVEEAPLPDETVIPVVKRPIPRNSTATVAPPYSRTELVHIRTFHVFEATKLNNDMVAVDANPMYI